MPEKTRTEYSARNTGVAMIARVLAILMGFFTRVVFTHTLSVEYVGINGLFTDILNVLALSEMGVGTAITYALYKPIAEGNIEKQKALMQLYKRFYQVVAALVLVAGLLFVPFLPYIMKDRPDIPGLTFIYLMYLANSVLSYFMIYKKTLVDASQLGYINVLYSTGFLVLQNILQIIVLLTTGNFVLFLGLLILCTLGSNIAISKRVERMYPFLREKDITPLLPAEKTAIYRNVRAMMMHKISDVLVNNTDNVLLASMISSVAVGRYSNYFLVIGSIRQVLNQAFQGITASVGNLGVSEDNDHIERVYNAATFVGAWMYGFAGICLYMVVDTFVGFCFGPSYIFEKPVTLVLCLNFYFWGVRQATVVFRDSMGLFKHDRWIAIVEAILNLVVSIVLGRIYGVTGVFLGTLVSMLLTSVWVGPFVVYRFCLKRSSFGYYLKMLGYAVLTAGLLFGIKYLFGNVSVFSVSEKAGVGLVLVFFLRIFVSAVIVNLVYLVVLSHTKEFRLLKKKAEELWERHMGKRQAGKLAGSEKNPEKLMNTDIEEIEKYKDFTAEQVWILKALKEGLTGKRSVAVSVAQNYGDSSADTKEAGDDSLDFDEVFKISRAHSVTPLIEKQLLGLAKQYSGDDLEKYESYTKSISKNMSIRSFQIIYLTKKLSDAFRAAGIQIIVMKGIATARFYGSPDKRKSGDVDILLCDIDRMDDAEKIILGLGCHIEEVQKTNHHVVYRYEKTGIPIELHTMLAEPFDNQKMNSYMESIRKECQENFEYVNAFGVEIPALKTAFHAYELLLHMLQHFLRAGFGIKLLCDWVVFWNANLPSEEEKDLYLRLVTESGVKGFSDIVTKVCVEYLGLEEKNAEFLYRDAVVSRVDAKIFLADIFEGEEFGHAEENRMVALRGNGIHDYFREFHHQMCLNNPKASKCVLLWPGLWIKTYVIFEKNNRELRKVDSLVIFKKAGNRGRMVKNMRLFEYGKK